MRPTYLFLALMITGPAPGVSAQAVPRTDTPRAGALRFTFEPVITTWEREFTGSGHEQPIGASLPARVFVHEERRVTPFVFEFGITNRIAVGVSIPLVRVNTRATFPLDSTGTQAPDSAARALDSLLQDTTYAFGPIANTTRRLLFFAGARSSCDCRRATRTHRTTCSISRPAITRRTSSSRPRRSSRCSITSG
ncbi:MAG: hypothetical protein AUH41_00965 [Gemmatimonadetes bacterium 13_1_40CM_66_11]|nr:MAG: hypothetical protein AUH41_00965 [Gemmatimonadetes bacterium 13_1_40CM_66_11]